MNWSKLSQPCVMLIYIRLQLDPYFVPTRPVDIDANRNCNGGSPYVDLGENVNIPLSDQTLLLKWKSDLHMTILVSQKWTLGKSVVPYEIHKTFISGTWGGQSLVLEATAKGLPLI